MKPFLLRGEEDARILRVELKGLSYIRPPHRARWEFYTALSLSLVLRREETGEGGNEEEEERAEKATRSYLHLADKNEKLRWRERSSLC